MSTTQDRQTIVCFLFNKATCDSGKHSSMRLLTKYRIRIALTYQLFISNYANVVTTLYKHFVECIMTCLYKENSYRYLKTVSMGMGIPESGV